MGKKFDVGKPPWASEPESITYLKDYLARDAGIPRRWLDEDPDVEAARRLRRACIALLAAVACAVVGLGVWAETEERWAVAAERRAEVVYQRATYRDTLIITGDSGVFTLSAGGAMTAGSILDGDGYVAWSGDSGDAFETIMTISDASDSEVVTLSAGGAAVDTLLLDDEGDMSPDEGWREIR